jgi:tripartite-type tricarboxylate transporter receptor subunit TctC
MLRTRTLGLLALVALGIAIAPFAGWSQAARTIKIVIAVQPGGTIDTLSRVLADHVGKTNGQTVIVESRPGAGGIIAAETVARAAPDGNTLLVNTNGMLINALLRKVSFDPITSFEPLCYLVRSPQVIAVNSASPYRSLAELIDAARAKPGELVIASVGPNTTQHLAIERLKRLAGVNLTYVPYTGGAPAINALMGGHITAVLQNYSEIGEQLRAGKLRALATPAAKRIEPLPDLPTVAESGYPGFEAEVWFGLVTTAKAPRETVSQLSDWFGAALRSPDVSAKLTAQGLYPNPTCGAEFAAYIRRQSEDFARVIRELNIKGG